MPANTPLNICLCTDSTNVVPALVSAHTALAKCAAQACEVVFLTDSSDPLLRVGMRRLEALHPQAHCVHLVLDRAKQALLDELAQGNHLPGMAYARLLLPEILSSWDRCLYIDTDVVVLDDLAWILDAVNSAHPLAAVVDTFSGMKGSFTDRHQSELGFAYEGSYINSGVLAFDLAAMRAEGLVNSFLEVARRRLPFGDQDVLNTVLRGRISMLPLRCNVHVSELEAGLLVERACYSVEERAAVCSGAVGVLHYIGREAKPWDYLQLARSAPWVAAAREALDEQVWELVDQRAAAYRQSIAFGGLISRCCHASELFIYGYTDVSRGLVDMLQQQDCPPVRAFFDHDEHKIGATYAGISCLSREHLDEARVEGGLLVVAAQNAYGQITHELEARGFPRSQMARYFRKTALYYRGLRPEFFREEAEDMVRALMPDRESQSAPQVADRLLERDPQCLREVLRAPLSAAFYPREWLLRTKEGGEPWMSMW